ncbi:type III secretion protein [Mesorhizobium sp.]|uniref:type III secretion protein n=1 Tax=Mesorhizobium sp. TaxID=1871066 RepID=UPI0025E1D07E|nr:type III secretion protein [Mesorhizobium sp.]
MDFLFQYWRTTVNERANQQRRAKALAMLHFVRALMETERETCRADCRHRAVRVRGLAAAVLVMGQILGIAFADAAEPHWPDGTYKYITINQAVADALVEFGHNIGTPVHVSRSVKGRLSAGMPVGSARKFLDSVCKRYGLVWHFDGSAINVVAEAEMQTEIIKLDATAAAGATERLDALGISEARFPIKVSEKDDVISVSGPPSYVSLVKKTLGVSASRAAQNTGLIPVRVFRGRQAEAQNFPAKKPDN